MTRRVCTGVKRRLTPSITIETKGFLPVPPGDVRLRNSFRCVVLSLPTTLVRDLERVNPGSRETSLDPSTQASQGTEVNPSVSTKTPRLP